MPRKEQIRWTVEEELSEAEEAICRRCQRNGRLYVFLRRHRLELFDPTFQEELTKLYADSPMGQPPLPPALLAMVTVLQAADGVSDEGAVNEAIFDRRWQMVLGCLGAEEAPFSQGALVDFRRRLIAKGLHLRLIDRSVALAKQTGGFGFTQLRVALDSAPLWGAGRVEDTLNLVAHALEVVVSCVAFFLERTDADVRAAAGLRLVGQSSLKAALDLDWDDPDERHRGLQELIGEVDRLRAWLKAEVDASVLALSSVQKALAQLERVLNQDLEPDPERGGQRITQGTAKDRQISIRDPSMRHGRKSSSTTIKGFKRFIAKELDHGLILGVTVQPANQPERDADTTLRAQVEKHGEVASLYIDRGFLASPWTAQMYNNGGHIVCRPWRPQNRGLFTKDAFQIDLDENTATCPAGKARPIEGDIVRFSAAICAACPLRADCTRAKEGRGRTLTIHPSERLMQQLSLARKTPEGRAELRKRVPVEHSLAHICNRQGRNARYVGLEKNIFDLCRYAFIENCFLADRLERRAA